MAFDFNNVPKSESGNALNPYAGRYNDRWIEGETSIEFLNKKFSQYSNAQGMIDATDSEGLKSYFAWLRDEKNILN